MTIIHYAVCGKNVWKLGSTLNRINILQSVYLNVFLHINYLQCIFNAFNKKLRCSNRLKNLVNSTVQIKTQIFIKEIPICNSNNCIKKDSHKNHN